MHKIQSLSCFPKATNTIWYSQKASLSHISSFSPRLQARFDILKRYQFLPIRCFPHGYKRDLIFTKGTNFSQSVVFSTATSAIWYSQKVQISPSPLFSPRLQARFDIHKKCQLRPFRCFPNCYKRDLMLIDSHGFTHCRVFHTVTIAINFAVFNKPKFHFPAFPRVLNSHTTAIHMRQKPISSAGRLKNRYFCPAGAKIWNPRHLYSNIPKWGGPVYLGGGGSRKIVGHSRPEKKKLAVCPMESSWNSNMIYTRNYLHSLSQQDVKCISLSFF